MNGFQLKITIKGSHPPIWRRIIIPVKATFENLHHVIQEIFGWEEEHLWSFYLPGQGMKIAPELYEDNDIEDEDLSESIECTLREILSEEEKFYYIYDFGDYWEHEIKVEKYVVDSGDAARVIKSKGAYMIEDCGGLSGYYDVIESALPFHIGRANAVLAGIPMGKFPKMTITLQDVLLQHKKESLLEMADIHGLKVSQGMNKPVLAEMIRDHLMKEDYLRSMLSVCKEETVTLFENAIEEDGIECTSEDIEDSLFLCSYGVLTQNDMFFVCSDVIETYQKVCTAEYKVQLKEYWKWMKYCESAIFLYGVLPVDKLVEIFNQYEVKPLEKEVFQKYFTAIMNSHEEYPIFVKKGFLMDSFLKEDDQYLDLIKAQQDMPYYIPETQKEFLEFAEINLQGLEQPFVEFIDYLQEKMELDFEGAAVLMLTVQEMIRKDWSFEYVLEMAAFLGVPELNRRKKNGFLSQIELLKRHVRLWKLRGFTQEEMFPTTAKVIPFRNKK